jgi:hypothetical protein
MQYSIVKLDHRHSYHDRFQYTIEFSKSTMYSSGVLDFDRSRKWFTEHYGWGQSVEIQEDLLLHRVMNEHHYTDLDINPVWAYSAKYRNYRIYVASDAEVSWFVLCHPKS